MPRASNRFDTLMQTIAESITASRLQSSRAIAAAFRLRDPAGRTVSTWSITRSSSQAALSYHGRMVASACACPRRHPVSTVRLPPAYSPIHQRYAYDVLIKNRPACPARKPPRKSKDSGSTLMTGPHPDRRAELMVTVRPMMPGIAASVALPAVAQQAAAVPRLRHSSGVKSRPHCRLHT